MVERKQLDKWIKESGALLEESLLLIRDLDNGERQWTFLREQRKPVDRSDKE